MRISDWSSDVCSSDLITDEADAVVLPYRDIVNSGSALLALSRFRPVIAPRLGSLIELQGQVGEDWLWLYDGPLTGRSEEHTSELPSLMRISYAVFCLKKKTNNKRRMRCRNIQTHNHRVYNTLKTRKW